jgi:hypothetical protein
MNISNKTGKYDDIINLPHPSSRKHPRMKKEDRAAQFSPFAALTGYDLAIAETARVTEEESELSEQMKTALNEKLQILLSKTAESPPVSIKYFVPDGKKQGGRYETKCGIIKAFDEYTATVIMDDKFKIAIESIREIDSDIFNRDVF